MTCDCPLYRAPCIEHRCTWYTQLFGHDPQTQVPLAEYRCAIAWLPIMLAENAQMSRQTGAAVESFRNGLLHEAQRAIALASDASDASDAPELLPRRSVS